MLTAQYQGLATRCVTYILLLNGEVLHNHPLPSMPKSKKQRRSAPQTQETAEDHPQDGRRWAGPGEISHIMGSIPEYLEAQKRGRYNKFWPAFFEGYFNAYPAPSFSTEATDGIDAQEDTEEYQVCAYLPLV